jgi:hypothetical protein
MFFTRQQLQNKVDAQPYSFYAEAMEEVFRLQEEVNTVGFHSDVYYVKAALEKHTGYVFPLPVVEAAMRQEGWREGKTNRRRK